MALLARFRAYLHKLKIDFLVDQQEFIQEFRKDRNLLPNKVTICRLLVSPIVGTMLFASNGNINFRWMASVIFAIVALTDRIDGYLARKNGQVTKLGAFLDPLVDKVLITVTIVPLIMVYDQTWIKMLMVLIILCELSVVWLTFRAKHKDNYIVVTEVGKIKMAVQCVAILLFIEPILLPRAVYVIIALVSIIATVWSLLIYYKEFKQNIVR